MLVQNSIPATAHVWRDDVVESKKEQMARPRKYTLAEARAPKAWHTKPLITFPRAAPREDVETIFDAKSGPLSFPMDGDDSDVFSGL